MSVEVIELLAADPEETGIFSDFDGTLAHIVDDPAGARPVEGAVEALTALAAAFGRVGVLSGRPAAFLRDNLGAHGLFLSGLYGMERIVDGRIEPAPEALAWGPVVEAEAARARREVTPGMVVEDKGLSFTLHFRQRPDLHNEAEAWTAEAAARSGLVVRPARLSFELCPPVSRTKGTALAEAAAGLSAVCFIGDDLGDLSAFDTLDALEGQAVAARRIAVASEESPRELLERADLIVDSPEATVELLQKLAAAAG